MGILSSILKPVTGIIDELVPDKDLREQLKTGVTQKILENEGEITRQAGGIIQAEAKSESWLARNWRPIAMLDFLGLINAYWFGLTPDRITEKIVLALFSLLQIGLGGYIIGRSAEKIAGRVAPAIKTWKGKKES